MCDDTDTSDALDSALLEGSELRGEVETLRALLRECITPVHAWPQYRELAQRLRAALGEQSTTAPHVKTAAEMRADAAHDTSCVGAFARARPGAN